MTLPADGRQFSVALARASKGAARFVRGLSAADREDVFGAAVLWCWEHRASYTGNVPLDAWFAGAVRHARRSMVLGAAHVSWEEVEAQLGTRDTTLAYAEALEVVRKLGNGLSRLDRQLAIGLLQGHTLDDLAARHHTSRSQIKRRLKVIRRLSRLFPDLQDPVADARTPAAVSSEAPAEELPPIDRELESLEFPPQHGADCRPCWRCKWFEGLLPADRRYIELVPRDPEVRAAVHAVEGMKISIARRVRAGGNP